MTVKYCMATNTGVGFLTEADTKAFTITGFPLRNLWIVEDSPSGNAWISRVSGVIKTKLEAQALCDAAIAEAKIWWDGLSAEDQVSLFNKEPLPLTLPD